MSIPKKKYNIARKQTKIFEKKKDILRKQMNVDDEDKDNENDNNSPKKIDDFDNYEDYLKFKRTTVYKSANLTLKYSIFVKNIILCYKKAIFVKLVKDADINQYICLYLNKIYQQRMARGMFFEKIYVFILKITYFLHCYSKNYLFLVENCTFSKFGKKALDKNTCCF